ncbi:MAG: dTDP-4-dehydrorhamnose reductase [Flavobacteriaceae bacterium]
MKNILVTGCNGQLGSELHNLASKYPEINFFFKDKDLDITNKEIIENYLTKNKINFIINTAAYTDVNNAEIQKQSADLVNEKGVKNLVELAEKYNCKLIHYSTDYVYNGENKSPLDEKGSTNPLNYYGISKRKGEKHIENSSCESIIIRTSWLYSNFGNNFVNTIIKKVKNKDKIIVVKDQFGCPTNAKDLALDTMNIVSSEIKLDKYGKIYNYSNLGFTNWSNFAKKIIEFLNIEYEIQEVSTDFFKSNVIRPKHSITNKNKIINTFNLNLTHWEKSLKTYLTNFQL